MSKIFDKIEFLLGAGNSQQFYQHHHSQLVFMGASNVGKSSLINALFGKKIAISSKTPGRTQQINFFLATDQKNHFVVADLPGYGFAKIAQEQFYKISDLCLEFLVSLSNNQKSFIFLLLDPSKQLKSADISALNFLQQQQLNFYLIFTKIDKCNAIQISELTQQITQIIPYFQEPFALVSSKNKTIIDLQKKIIKHCLKNF